MSGWNVVGCCGMTEKGGHTGNHLIVFGDERLPERFWLSVVRGGDCWLRLKSIGAHGYSRFQMNGVGDLAHRWVCRLSYGDPPADKPFTLHSCDVRNCINPDHLRWGNNADNMQDIVDRKRSHWLTKTHCPQGHPYEGDNLVVREGRRFCRACQRIRGLAYYYKTRKLKPDNCPNGHPYVDGSFEWHSRGHRQCLTCLHANRERNNRG